MNDWVVETPSFEEDLMNNRIIMLNQNGVNRVIEIIKERDKEIKRLKSNEKTLADLLDKEQNKNKKAIEYINEDLEINELLYNSDSYQTNYIREELLEILKGESK